jgi:nucleoside-diphosphate-sugar epimerase
VIGAAGQIGVELVTALSNRYGKHRVVAADVRKSQQLDHCIPLSVLDRAAVTETIRTFEADEVYMLAAMLSATGEKAPEKAWELNMQGLLNVLEAALETGFKKVFFPSSIAVYGLGLGEPQTVYRISKFAGESWCNWYHKNRGLDVRCLRYPGLISHTAKPGGGTTDYAVEIFHEALNSGHYSCYLPADSRLPMMYMDDAVRATLELMEAPAEQLSTRMGYDIAAMSFTPAELAVAIREQLPEFTLDYAVDPVKQSIARSWPGVIDDSLARRDWGWQPQYDLPAMTRQKIASLASQLSVF